MVGRLNLEGADGERVADLEILVLRAGIARRCGRRFVRLG
jgi:hypothetical protein